MNKQQIEKFISERRGYLKKSALELAKALWKKEGLVKKTNEEIRKELELVAKVHKDFKKANVIQDDSLLRIYEEIKGKEKKLKKCFFDLEVSPNVGFFWQSGYKLNISPENIIHERAVICACYKFEGEPVKSIQWNNGDDRELLVKLAEVINSADVIIGHNSIRFDTPWLRTRCLFHGIYLKPKINQIDTLQIARFGYRFNSNKLDYIAKFLGGKGKTSTNFGMWKDIVLKNDKKALKEMVDYCKNDVTELEEIYNKLQAYVPEKKFSRI